jgi:hypothetical protein
MSLGPELLELGPIERMDFFERNRQAADRIAHLPSAEIVLPLYSNVFVFAVTDVSAPAICNELEETRTLASADGRHSFACCGANCCEVVSVSARPRNPVRFCITAH